MRPLTATLTTAALACGTLLAPSPGTAHAAPRSISLSAPDPAGDHRGEDFKARLRKKALEADLRRVEIVNTATTTRVTFHVAAFKRTKNVSKEFGRRAWASRYYAVISYGKYGPGFQYSYSDSTYAGQARPRAWVANEGVWEDCGTVTTNPGDRTISIYFGKNCYGGGYANGDRIVASSSVTVNAGRTDLEIGSDSARRSKHGWK